MTNNFRTALVAAIGAIIGGVIVTFGNYVVMKRQAEVKMIEVAVGILAAKPDDNIKPARSWAVDVLELYSPVQLKPDVKAALLNHPLPVGQWKPTFLEGVFGGAPFGGAPFGGPPPKQ